jgi:hypothetical protein
MHGEFQASFTPLAILLLVMYGIFGALKIIEAIIDYKDRR